MDEHREGCARFRKKQKLDFYLSYNEDCECSVKLYVLQITENGLDMVGYDVMCRIQTPWIEILSSFL